VHRDVKPANILVRRDGTAKITDFGIARISSQTITKSGFSMGTPAYMAPEQIMSARVTGQADQFSLAVMAYQMLSGRRPFVAETDPALIFEITSREPQPLHELDRSFSARTSDVLKKGLAKDPNLRFANCAAFIQSLSDSLEEKRAAAPVAAQPIAVPEAGAARSAGSQTRSGSRWSAVAVWPGCMRFVSRGPAGSLWILRSPAATSPDGGFGHGATGCDSPSRRETFRYDRCHYQAASSGGKRSHFGATSVAACEPENFGRSKARASPGDSKVHYHAAKAR
jgi:serine/threonine-protein kinase